MSSKVQVVAALIVFIFHLTYGTPDNAIKSINLSKDVNIGGLFTVHIHSKHHICSKNISHVGIQRIEAMLYAVKKINHDRTLLK